MAIDNIDLSREIKAWKDAAYGKDVRAANVAAFEKIQGTVNDTVQNVNQASKDASSASQNAQKAVNDIQSAIETATSKASEASGSAVAAETSKEAAASSAEAADTSKIQAAASAAEAKKIAQGLGDFDGTAAKVKTTDTYGLVVSALGESTAQALIDAIANKVMNDLINKNKIVNNLLATDPTTVLAGTQGVALGERLTAAESAVAQLNSDASKIVRVPVLIKTGTNILKLDAGIYDYEDFNASEEEKLAMGFPKAIWHSTIFVFGKYNSDETGYINIFVIDCNADSSTIYHNFHKWTNWSGWNKISVGSI